MNLIRKSFAIALLLALSASANTSNQAYAASNADSSSINEFSIGLCHFRITNLDGGWFRIPSRNTAIGVYMMNGGGATESFPISCVDASDKNAVDNAMDVKSVDGTFIWLDSNEPFDKAQHFTQIPLKGSNWEGSAVTYDEITGDEDKRWRFMHFCLIHNAEALCSQGNILIMPLKSPKQNSFKKIKAVLETIEFVD